MKKITLESFCRDSFGELMMGPDAEWSNKPFRVGGMVFATNGHILIWRAAKPEDPWLEIEEDDKSEYPPRGPRVIGYTKRHPGANACHKPWPTCDAVREEGFAYPAKRVYFPQKLRVSVDAIYRDRITWFGKSLKAPVLYATPRSATKPVAFMVGEYSGLLMPLRNH